MTGADPEALRRRAEKLRTPPPVFPRSPEFVCSSVYAGKRCTDAPVFGTSACPKHLMMWKVVGGKVRLSVAENLGGKADRLLREAGLDMRVSEAAAEIDVFRRKMQVDPGVVLLEEVSRAAAVVAWLEDKIGRMTEESVMHEPELLRIRERKRSQNAGGDSYEVERSEERTTVSRYWKLLQEERRLLVRASEAALRSNIEERRVRLAERGVNVLEAAVAAALTDLGLDPHSDAVRAVVGRRMREALEAGGSGGIFLGTGADASLAGAPLSLPSERVPEPVEKPAAPPPAVAF